MPAGSDLASLLRSLSPRLRPERFVFVTPPAGLGDVVAMATVVEPEGVSAVVTVEQAERLGVDHLGFVAAWITLEVHSSLDAVGLTAAVSTALTAAGISCNIIAGARHDHLLVPWTRREDAVSLLELLSARGPAGAV